MASPKSFGDFVRDAPDGMSMDEILNAWNHHRQIVQAQRYVYHQGRWETYDPKVTRYDLEGFAYYGPFDPWTLPPYDSPAKLSHDNPPISQGHSPWLEEETETMPNPVPELAAVLVVLGSCVLVGGLAGAIVFAILAGVR